MCERRCDLRDGADVRRHPPPKATPPSKAWLRFLKRDLTIWFLRSVISSWQTTTEEAARGSAVRAIVVPPPSFARDMEGLLADADTHGDITVKILKRDQLGPVESGAPDGSGSQPPAAAGGAAAAAAPGGERCCEFKAHRAVLMARSSVFRAMLDSSGMAETRANTLTLAQVRLLSFSPLFESMSAFS